MAHTPSPLLQEIDAYKRCLPQLKTTMRGAGWEENHWLQVCEGLWVDGWVS